MTIASSPQPRQRIDAWTASHQGLVREGNEDAFRCTPARGIFVIADGIGGGPGGELASSIAVEAAHESLIRSPEMPAPAMRRAFAYANSSVVSAADRNPQLRGMGTTLVAALVSRGEIAIAWCGDSRAYLIRQGAMMLLTKDHGAEHVLHSFIGDPQQATCEIRGIVSQPGDRLLLCSDGLSNYVPEHLILHAFRSHKEPKPIAAALINEALRAGGMDNVTVSIVRVR